MRSLTINEVYCVSGGDGLSDTTKAAGGASAILGAIGKTPATAGALASFAGGSAIGDVISNNLSDSTKDAIGGTISGVVDTSFSHTVNTTIDFWFG